MPRRRSPIRSSFREAARRSGSRRRTARISAASRAAARPSSLRTAAGSRFGNRADAMAIASSSSRAGAASAAVGSKRVPRPVGRGRTPDPRLPGRLGRERAPARRGPRRWQARRGGLREPRRLELLPGRKAGRLRAAARRTLGRLRRTGGRRHRAARHGRRTMQLARLDPEGDHRLTGGSRATHPSPWLGRKRDLARRPSQPRPALAQWSASCSSPRIGNHGADADRVVGRIAARGHDQRVRVAAVRSRPPHENCSADRRLWLRRVRGRAVA
jgi:hypothetical protein